MTPTTKLFSSYTPKRYLLWAALLLLALSFVSGAYFRNVPPANLEQKDLEHYLHRQQKAFARLLADTPLVRKLAQRNESSAELGRLQNLPFGIFLYAESPSGQELIFWNTQNVLPASPSLTGREGTSLQFLANGFYLVTKKKLQLSGLAYKVQAFALIPVLYQYKVQSHYLSDHFAHSKDAHNKISLSVEPTPFPIKGTSGETLFYLNRKAFTRNQQRML